ncbi:MAG: DUF1697 domain-containing protein [Actinomycetes bacterium]
MSLATHVALIRGINVGGHNIVPMAQLRESLAARGLDRVRTYIQSGNVLFGAPGLDEIAAAEAVEAALVEDFSVDTVVVAAAADSLRAVVATAPAGFGGEPDLYHYDVAFLRPGVSSEEARAAFGIREGVDTAWAGERAVYFRRLSAQRTKSRMSTVMPTPFYRVMTIRNWRTTTRLAQMLDEH